MVKESVFECESHVELNVVKSNWALNLNVNITVQCAWTNGILFGEHILRNIEDLIKTDEKEISYQ